MGHLTSFLKVFLASNPPKSLHRTWALIAWRFDMLDLPHYGKFDILVCQIPTIAPYKPKGSYTLIGALCTYQYYELARFYQRRESRGNPKLLALRNVLIAYIIVLLDHQCCLFPQFENVMMQLSNKCCDLLNSQKDSPVMMS